MSFKKILLPNKQTKNPCYILEGGGTQHGTRTFSQLCHHHTQKKTSFIFYFSLIVRPKYFPFSFGFSTWVMNDGIYNTRTNERKIEKSIGDYPPSSKQIFIYAVSKISWGCLCKNKLERQKPAGQQTAHFAKTTWPPLLIFHALFRPLTIKKKKSSC